MRVIAGSARGKKLESPKGFDIRPTLDRVKESVFNMIAFELSDSSVLDLFCGSGALGIEALSRGAKRAVFVDSSRTSLEVAQKNLEITRLSDRASLVFKDAISFLKTTTETFDIIFLDPPYESDLYEKVLFEIKKRGILSPAGLIVIEADDKISPQFSLDGFTVYRDKTYGRVKILIMKE